jgi:hypothetical protein
MSSMHDGISYKVRGPDGVYYFVPCAYTESTVKCGFVCRPFSTKWPDGKGHIFCVEQGKMEVFDRLVERGTFVACPHSIHIDTE